ncbi:MAG: nucleoside monophosphate kinase [Alphaproteobacteria bacterium]|nr:nucleoside monophosphate kinase [Alphaproteobacteria bacterium]
MSEVKVLVLFGAPGAGKGTVAQHLSENYDVHHFSTGNLLRNEVKVGSDIGLKVQEILGSGGLVGSDIVNEMVQKNISEVVDSERLIVLDGYPRTVDQAQVLDGMLSGALKDRVRVLELSVDDEVVVKRISQRRVCVKCGNTYGPHDKIEVCSCGGDLVRRKDDDEAVVRSRLAQYEKETRPVAAYYGERLLQVSGDGKPEEVAQRVSDALANFRIGKRR